MSEVQNIEVVQSQIYNPNTTEMPPSAPEMASMPETENQSHQDEIQHEIHKEQIGEPSPREIALMRLLLKLSGGTMSIKDIQKLAEEEGQKSSDLELREWYTNGLRAANASNLPVNAEQASSWNNEFKDRLEAMTNENNVSRSRSLGGRIWHTVSSKLGWTGVQKAA